MEQAAGGEGGRDEKYDAGGSACVSVYRECARGHESDRVYEPGHVNMLISHDAAQQPRCDREQRSAAQYNSADVCELLAELGNHARALVYRAEPRPARAAGWTSRMDPKNQLSTS